MGKSKLSFVALFVVMGTFSILASAQNKDYFESSWRYSEINSAQFDDIASFLYKDQLPLIVIAHLGAGDRSRIFNQRRLHNIRAHFVIHEKIAPARIIVAEGPASEGKGFVDLFVAGKLRMKIIADRGRDILVDCCPPFPDYYPEYRGRPILK